MQGIMQKKYLWFLLRYKECNNNYISSNKSFPHRNVFVTPNIRNMKYKIIIGLSAILYFTGCYNREQTPRLSEAEKLMQNNPDILTKDVAEMVGFSDAFYFSRVFKSHEGMSPSQFLKNLRKD